MDAVTVLQTVLSAIQTGSIGGLNVSDVISSANVTVGTTTSSLAATSFSPLQIPALVFKLWTVSAVRDWLKLLLMGAALEFCRRSVTTSWDAIRNYFWITVTLDEGDDCGCECLLVPVPRKSTSDPFTSHSDPQIGSCIGCPSITYSVSPPPR